MLLKQRVNFLFVTITLNRSKLIKNPKEIVHFSEEERANLSSRNIRTVFFFQVLYEVFRELKRERFNVSWRKKLKNFYFRRKLAGVTFSFGKSRRGALIFCLRLNKTKIQNKSFISDFCSFLPEFKVKWKMENVDVYTYRFCCLKKCRPND